LYTLHKRTFRKQSRSRAARLRLSYGAGDAKSAFLTLSLRRDGLRKLPRLFADAIFTRTENFTWRRKRRSLFPSQNLARFR